MFLAGRGARRPKPSSEVGSLDERHHWGPPDLEKKIGGIRGIRQGLKTAAGMVVLNSNWLALLPHRWADGKGPLAAEFSPAEVKSLIRALFQNTERRAAALAKIR